MGYALKESFGQTIDDGNDWGYNPRQYLAHSFIPASSYRVTQLGVTLAWDAASPPSVGTITAYCYADAAGPVPGAVLGTSTNTVNAATQISAVEAELLFQFSGIDLSSGVRYWVVLNGLSAAQTNYSYMASDSSLQTGYLLFSILGTTVWVDSGYGNTIQGAIKTYVSTIAADDAGMDSGLSRSWVRDDRLVSVYS